MAVTSLLTSVTIPLIKQSLEAIRRAGDPHVPDRLASVDQLAIISALVVLVYGIKYWFTRGQTTYLSHAATRLANDLRLRMFDKLQRLPVSYFNERRSGAIQSVLTNDVNVYQTAVTIIRDSIEGPLKAALALGWIVYIQWQLALVTLLFLPPMAFVIQRNARKMRAAQAEVQQDLANLNAMSQESLQGARVVKALGAEEHANRTYSALVEASFRSTMAAVRRLATLRPMVELLGACALAAVLTICGWLAYRGSLSVPDIAALVYALDMINQGARSMGSVNTTYAQVQAASERIYREILDAPEEHLEARGDRRLAEVKGRIEFRGVSFSYPDGTEALRKVSFSIEPGTSLALVGPSGAGKSTIADLLLRFYDPGEGEILLDGVDLRELDVAWLRGLIGVVPQQTFLFAGTIEENVRLGRADASDEEVREAASAAHADVFIVPMPNGYQTELGERGIRLSGGEMQRLAIARAVVRQPRILLLDEATSSLDAHSEKAVQAALDEIMRSRTTLFIAHRLTTAARADRILVLRKGEVLEQGSHRLDLDRRGQQRMDDARQLERGLRARRRRRRDARRSRGHRG
ncbi:MAG: ABC transporter ATP-binding protein, partial [Fimbriimonas ginsengisoli]|nr:ABC transporter ATP-binding protein [Fimbriimonas ginsengisoli]